MRPAAAPMDDRAGGCETSARVASTPCPRCGATAPPIVRAGVPRCAACGAPLVDPRVATAGKPAQVGGTIVRVVGWAVLAGGLVAALLVGLVLQWLIPAGIAGWVLGGMIAMMTLAVSLLLLMGGGRLRDAGAKKEQDARTRALWQLAQRQRGVVTADEAARAMGVSTADADAVLTDLVKQGGDVRLEVDDDGNLLYLFGPHAVAATHARVRVAPYSDRRAEDAAAYDEAAAAEAEESARRRGAR